MLTALIPIFVLTGSARAAEVTELAPMLRGDLDLRYNFDTDSSRLVEAGEEVGKRVLAAHQLTYAGEFSFIKGAGVFFEIPHPVSQTITFPDAHEMSIDADFGAGKEAGTMIGSDELSTPPEVKGSGIGGTWVGLRGTPFSEELFQRRGDRVSWLLEVGYRFKDKSNFWTLNDSGNRGAGDGAPAFRLNAAFSTTYRANQPYLTVGLVRTGRIDVDVADADGTTVATGLIIRPASVYDLGVGTELLAGEYDAGETKGQVKLDFNLHFGYRSWQDIPSGIYLPSILDLTRSIAVTESEYAYAKGGLGVNWRIVEYAQLNVAGDVGTATPQRIEHPYPVDTAMGNVEWGIHTVLRFRARDPLFEGK